MKDRVYIGVDPGHSGAIAFYLPKNGQLNVYDMPLRLRRGSDTRNELDVHALAVTLRRYQQFDCMAVVELVGARTYVVGGVARGQGAAASFAFGKSAGVIVGMLAALNISHIEVPPGVWKSSLNLSADKNQSRALASEKFPKHGHLFARKKDDGRAEAALLARYAQKVLEGT